MLESPLVLAPRSSAEDLQSAVALATHQCAALAADVEATVQEAISRLQHAVRDAEARLQLATSLAVERIEAVTARLP